MQFDIYLIRFIRRDARPFVHDYFDSIRTHSKAVRISSLFTRLCRASYTPESYTSQIVCSLALLKLAMAFAPNIAPTPTLSKQLGRASAART